MRTIFFSIGLVNLAFGNYFGFVLIGMAAGAEVMDMILPKTRKANRPY